LETLRAQLGHHDTESLRRYLEALKSDRRAAKVAEVFSVKLEDDITPVSTATVSRVM